MKNRIIAICDNEAAYAYSLADYFNNKNKLFFSEAFTNEECLLDYAAENYIDVLLVSDKVKIDLIQKKNVGMVVIIAEQEAVQAIRNYPTIYKYQSAGNILKNIMNFYAEREDEPLSILNKSCNIIGVYSPIKRSLKTSFCLTLGQILAKERGVLYINMEEYAGFSTIFQKEYKSDLSDLIYYLRQDKSNIMVKLEGIVDSVNNLDYVPPATSPMDIREVKKDDWQKLLYEISANSKYETIILDFGDGVDGLLELLSKCNKIYMPIREDYMSAAKIEQFEKLLHIAGYDELNEKIKKVKLPYHNSFGSRECYAEQLIWSELGDYVRQIAR